MNNSPVSVASVKNDVGDYIIHMNSKNRVIDGVKIIAVIFGLRGGEFPSEVRFCPWHYFLGLSSTAVTASIPRSSSFINTNLQTQVSLFLSRHGERTIPLLNLLSMLTQFNRIKERLSIFTCLANGISAFSLIAKCQRCYQPPHHRKGSCIYPNQYRTC